jgi:hypothetical protein
MKFLMVRIAIGVKIIIVKMPTIIVIVVSTVNPLTFGTKKLFGSLVIIASVELSLVVPSAEL